MKQLKVEVLGTEPPCARCASTAKNAERAASKLRQTGVEVKVEKLNIISKEVVSRYGVLVSPAVAVNGVVKIMGRVPSEAEMERILKEASGQ